MFYCKYSRRSRFHLCYWNCLFFFFFPALFQIKIFSHFICFLYGSLYQASDTIILFLLFEYVYLSSTIKLSIQSGNMHNFICYTLCKLYSDLFICLFFILAFIYFSLILLGFISSNGECKNIFAEQYRQEHWWFFWYIWNLIYECKFFFPSLDAFLYLWTEKFTCQPAFSHFSNFTGSSNIFLFLLNESTPANFH